MKLSAWPANVVDAKRAIAVLGALGIALSVAGCVSSKNDPGSSPSPAGSPPVNSSYTPPAPAPASSPSPPPAAGFPAPGQPNPNAYTPDPYTPPGAPSVVDPESQGPGVGPGGPGSVENGNDGDGGDGGDGGSGSGGSGGDGGG